MIHNLDGLINNDDHSLNRLLNLCGPPWGGSWTLGLLSDGTGKLLLFIFNLILSQILRVPNFPCRKAPKNGIMLKIILSCIISSSDCWIKDDGSYFTFGTLTRNIKQDTES